MKCRNNKYNYYCVSADFHLTKKKDNKNIHIYTSFMYRSGEGNNVFVKDLINFVF